MTQSAPPLALFRLPFIASIDRKQARCFTFFVETAATAASIESSVMPLVAAVCMFVAAVFSFLRCLCCLMRALAYLVIGLIKPDLYASSKEGGRELSQAIHSFASTPIIFTAALAGIPFAWIVYASN